MKMRGILKKLSAIVLAGVMAVSLGSAISRVSDGQIGTTEAYAALTVSFKDVHDSSTFYYEPVYWASSNGIVKGWSDNTFRPWRTCNRAAVVTFLWRIAGEPEPSSIATFKDMPANTKDNQDFIKAISWAVEKDITTGWSDNTFRPWRTCNRAAIMTFIWRFAGEPSASKSKFKDHTGNADFDTAIAWASENKIATGYDDGTFGSWRDCNRASVVTFLYRYVHSPSASGFSSQLLHTHNWQPVYSESKTWVVDQKAWDEMVAVGSHYECRRCGEAFGSDEDAVLEHSIDTGHAYHVVTDYETIHHDEQGHYETTKKLTGYKCSCGATIQ